MLCHSLLFVFKPNQTQLVLFLWYLACAVRGCHQGVDGLDAVQAVGAMHFICRYVKLI